MSSTEFNFGNPDEEVVNLIYRDAERRSYYAQNGMRPDGTPLSTEEQQAVFQLGSTVVEGMRLLAQEHGYQLSLDPRQIQEDTGQMMMDAALECRDVNGNPLTKEAAREYGKLGRNMRDDL